MNRPSSGPYFSSDYVNIGLDEAYGLGKYQIEEYCREKGKDVVFMEWLNKLSSHIRDHYGKKLPLWKAADASKDIAFLHLGDKVRWEEMDHGKSEFWKKHRK